MAFLPVLMSPQNGCLKQVTSNVRSFWGRYTQKCEQEAGTVAGSSGVRMVSNQPPVHNLILCQVPWDISEA